MITLLLIPKEIRRQFLDELLDNAVFKDELFRTKNMSGSFATSPAPSARPCIRNC